MISKYNGSLTREQFLFYEIRTVAVLTQQGLSRDEITEQIINSASSKNRTAKSLGVPIISEEEFVKRFGKP